MNRPILDPESALWQHIAAQDQVEAEIARCDREIAEMLVQPEGAPAWLTTLGIEDWKMERRIIERSALADRCTHQPG